MPVFEEGEATENSPYDLPRRSSPKRRKSLFASDFDDPKSGGSQGKLQLTFEESLKKAAAKKAEAPKAPKTLDYFFSSPKAEKQSKKEGRKEVAVDDFFASSLSSKVGSAILVIHSRLLHERKPLLWSPRHRRL